jgi:hypothetical protein
VMPWGPVLRIFGCGLLLSVLLMRPPGPRPGELWVDVLDVEAATAVIVSTTGHKLVFGSGETFGSRGQKFEVRIARRLLAQGGRRIGVFYIGPASADQMRAVLAADALLEAGLVVRDPVRSGPPEIAACATRSWRWDDVGFELASTPSGKSCVLIVNAHGGRMVLSPEWVDAGPADLLLLPRSADAARVTAIRQELRAGGFAIASIDRRQWQAGRWRELRRMLSETGINLRSTADEGDLHFEIGPRHGSRIHMQTGSGLQPGIWSRQTRANSCAVGL